MVIGAGVVGLAVARALALAGREVLLLEAETHPGTITSARNSGVIHAGLYYTPGSFKARFCVAGNRALVRLLQGARRRAPQLRQAHRRQRRRRRAGAAAPARTRARQRRRRRAADLGHRSSQARARSALHRGAALPHQRHRRSASLHAGAAGRHGKCRRHAGVRLPRGEPRALGQRLSREDRRRQRHGNRSAFRGQQRGSRRGRPARTASMAIRSERIPTMHLGARQLLHGGRAFAVQASHLSGAARRGARHPRHARPRQTRALRPGRRVDRPDRLLGERRARAAVLRRHPPLLAEASPTAR